MKTKTILTISLLLLFSLQIFAQNDKHSKKLEEYLENEEYQKAIAYKNNKLDKLEGTALYYKGLAFYFSGFSRNAVDLFDLAIEKDGIDIELAFYKGWALIDENKFEKAIETFDEGIKIDPSDPEFYIGKGISYYYIDSLNKSSEAFNKALLFEDCDPLVNSYLGHVNFDLKNYDKAIENYKATCKLSGEGSEEYMESSYNVASAQYMSKKYQETKQTLAKHIELYPNDYQAIMKLIQAHYALYEIDKTNDLVEILTNAYNKNVLPDEYRKMYCIDQFDWNETLIMVFSSYEKYENDPVIWKHKFYILDEEADIDYKVETHLDTSANSEMDIYKICLIKNDTLFNYSNYQYEDNSNYYLLRDAIINVLNDEVEADDFIEDYNIWIAIQDEKIFGTSGTSFEDAIIVNSVPEEYQWLREHYPGYKLIQQSLVFDEEKPYDILEFKTADGRKKEIYFDISGFFGKGF